MSRYVWGAHGAAPGMLEVVDWESEGGPRVVGCVPDDDEGRGIEAARAIVRLLESDGASKGGA